MNDKGILDLFKTYFKLDETGKIEIVNGVINIKGSVLPINYTVNSLIQKSSKNPINQLPIQFGQVDGTFDCSGIGLTTLKGCPTVVRNGSFFCDDNKLKNLKYAPKEIGGTFLCTNNQLTTLLGCPTNIPKQFYCNNNQLTTLIGGPIYVKENYHCMDNRLQTLKGAPQRCTKLICKDNPDLYDISAATHLELLYDVAEVKKNRLLKKFTEDNGTQGMSANEVIALTDAITDIFS